MLGSLLESGASPLVDSFQRWRAPAFSAAKVAARHAFKDGDKRRLFGEHIVLAGLPA